MKYKVSVMTTRSYMSDQPANYQYTLNEATHVELEDKSYEQIGKFPNCARCKIMRIYPSGLWVTVFITDETSDVPIVEMINEFLSDERKSDFEWDIRLPEDCGGGYQKLIIKKIPDGESLS